MFKLKIKEDDKTILRAKADKIEKFDNIIKELKIKFDGDP